MIRVVKQYGFGQPKGEECPLVGILTLSAHN